MRKDLNAVVGFDHDVMIVAVRTASRAVARANCGLLEWKKLMYGRNKWDLGGDVQAGSLGGSMDRIGLVARWLV